MRRKLSIRMDSKELLLDSLEKSGAAYRKKLKLSQDEFSRKRVHDLRTSIRRLLAILDVVRFVTSAGRKRIKRKKDKDEFIYCPACDCGGTWNARLR